MHGTVAGVLLALTIPDLSDGGPADESPLLRLEHRLTRVSAFVIVPIFALANAGVAISGEIAGVLGNPIAVAIVAGLLVGKQIGIAGVAWLAVRARLAALPEGVGWRHVYAASWVCAIGFTMSLFIAALAYGESDALPTAKVGILTASIIAGSMVPGSPLRHHES